MKNKVIIPLFIILSLLVYFWQFHKSKNSKDMTATASSRQQNYFIKQKMAHNISENQNTALTEASSTQEDQCLSLIDQNLKEHCPENSCVYKNLKKHNSWASTFLEDGWDRKISAPKAHQCTALGQALYALSKADLLVWNDYKATPNLNQAISALQALAADDPGNSFPLIYLAEIYRRQGRHDESELYLEKATASGMQFNSYLKDFVKELTLNNQDNPTELVASTGIWAAAPIADYLAIRDLIDAHPKYAEDIAYQMAYDGLTSKVTTEMDWVPIEYAVAQGLYKKHVPHKQIPTLKEIINKLPRRYFPADSSNPDCNGQIEDYLHYLKNI